MQSPQSPSCYTYGPELGEQTEQAGQDFFYLPLEQQQQHTGEKGGQDHAQGMATEQVTVGGSEVGQDSQEREMASMILAEIERRGTEGGAEEAQLQKLVSTHAPSHPWAQVKSILEGMQAAGIVYISREGRYAAL